MEQRILEFAAALLAEPDFAIRLAQPNRNITHTVDAEKYVWIVFAERFESWPEPKVCPVRIRGDVYLVDPLKIEDARYRIELTKCRTEMCHRSFELAGWAKR